MSLCQKYFCYFQQNHPEFQKIFFFPCLYRIYQEYNPNQTIRDFDRPPAISGGNTIQMEVEAMDFHFHL
jgi:hypothetical protein